MSESLLRDGTFGVYLVSKEEPSLEYLLFCGCQSPDEARTLAKGLLQKVPALAAAGRHPEHIGFRVHLPAEMKSRLRLMSEQDVAGAINTHLKNCSEQLSRWNILKSLFSHQNAIMILMCIAIWLFWTKGSSSRPQDIHLPVFGFVLSVPTLAQYYPVAIFVLYALVFWHIRKTCLINDLLRKHILTLVLLHDWRILDFVRLLQAQFSTSGAGWLVNLVETFSDSDPGSVAGLRKQAGASTGHRNWAPADLAEEGRPRVPGVQEALNRNRAPADLAEEGRPRVPGVQEALNVNLARWTKEDFERRIHSLYFLDKEKDYGPSLIFFDPILYALSTNRVRYRPYVFLRSMGVPVDDINAPHDPSATEGFLLPVFVLSEVFRFCFIGGVMTWSFFVAAGTPLPLVLANLVATVLVLLVPFRWNYGALVQKRGFPKMEPLGAYTVGEVVPNHPLLL